MNPIPYIENLRYINILDKTTNKQLPEDTLFNIYKQLFTHQEKKQILNHANNQQKDMDNFLNDIFKTRNKLGGRKKSKNNSKSKSKR